MLAISLSPKFANKIANEFWQKTIITHGSMREENFDFYYNELLKIINPSKKDKILDYGGGNGEIAYRFKKQGFKIYHCDINDKMVNNAKKLGLRSCNCNNIKQLKEWGNFKIIIFNNAFFYIHPKNQKFILKVLLSLLENEGKIYITDTPDYDKRQYVLNKVLYLITTFFPVYQIDSAGFFIKDKDLRKLAMNIGFKRIRKLNSWNNYRSHWILEK